MKAPTVLLSVLLTMSAFSHSVFGAIDPSLCPAQIVLKVESDLLRVNVQARALQPYSGIGNYCSYQASRIDTSEGQGKASNDDLSLSLNVEDSIAGTVRFTVQNKVFRIFVYRNGGGVISLMKNHNDPYDIISQEILSKRDLKLILSNH